MQKRITMPQLLVFIVCTFGACFVSIFYYGLMMAGIEYETLAETCQAVLSSFPLKTYLILCAVVLIAGIPLWIFRKKVFPFLYKYRWWIGLVLIVLGTVFRINGSSMGGLASYLPDGQETGILFGRSQAIRTDEYAVFTPMTISQYANGFPYFADSFRGTTTDMFAVYGQPVWNILVLFRPFQIAYLFLPVEYGFAFFWCARMVFLFLVSLEFGMLVFKNKKSLAAVYAFCVTFSGWVVWWYAINCLVEMLIFGQAIVLMINGYATHHWKWRWLYALGFAWLSVSYILTMYPAWEIPLFYVFAAVGIGVLVWTWKEAKYTWKDALMLVGIIVFVAAFCGLFLYQSRDAIEAVVNSSYPGIRDWTGGPWDATLCWWTAGPFLPVERAFEVPLAWSHYGTCFCLAPFGLICAILYLIHKRKDMTREDALIIALIIVDVFLYLFEMVVMPSWLAKITLITQVTEARLYPVITFVDMILLFAVLARDVRISRAWAVVLALLCTVLNMLGSLHSWSETMVPVDFIVLAILLSVFFFLAFFALRSQRAKNWLLGLLAFEALLTGAIVNPVRQGMDTILENPAFLAAQKIAREDDGKWIVVSADHRVANVLAAAGASVINSTNTYSNKALWQTLSTDPDDYEVYDRYAHIKIDLQRGIQDSFELNYPDDFTVHMNVDDLSKLGVSWIYSAGDITFLNDDNMTFEPVETFSNGATIYKVVYH